MSDSGHDAGAPIIIEDSMMDQAEGKDHADSAMQEEQNEADTEVPNSPLSPNVMFYVTSFIIFSILFLSMKDGDVDSFFHLRYRRTTLGRRTLLSSTITS